MTAPTPPAGEPLFNPGGIVFTPAAQARITAFGASRARPQVFHDLAVGLLQRHMRGDWGVMPPEDAAENDAAVRTGEARIFSAYRLDNPRATYDPDARTDTTIWVITEHDRSVTTLLLPEDY